MSSHHSARGSTASMSSMSMSGRERCLPGRARRSLFSRLRAHRQSSDMHDMTGTRGEIRRTPDRVVHVDVEKVKHEVKHGDEDKDENDNSRSRRLAIRGMEDSRLRRLLSREKTRLRERVSSLEMANIENDVLRARLAELEWALDVVREHADSVRDDALAVVETASCASCAAAEEEKVPVGP